MKKNSENNLIIDFQSKINTDSDIAFIFSPFLPFSNVLPEKFFSELNCNIKYIYTRFKKQHIKITDYNFENIVYSYTNFIDNLKSTKIYLFGFGIFANLFVHLAKIHEEKIESLILIEPDFSNSFFLKVFESNEKPFFKQKYFIKTFLQYAYDINFKPFLDKNYLNILKNIYFSFKEYLPQNIVLKEIVEIKPEIFVLWKIMEKELWPLPQILQEDYQIKTISLENNIFDFFYNVDKNMLKTIDELVINSIENY